MRWRATTCPAASMPFLAPGAQVSQGGALNHVASTHLDSWVWEWHPLFADSLSLSRRELLGVRCWEADPRARVHQEPGPVGVWDPGGAALGPRAWIPHLLVQVRQLLEVQSPAEPSGVCVPTQHEWLDRHPGWCGCCLQGPLRYADGWIERLIDRLCFNLRCALSFRLCTLYPGEAVLEVRPSQHELFGGLPSLRRYGFFRL